MRDFWRFARRLLRYRWMLIGAGACALVSAGGLGAGIAGLAPILKNILTDEGSTLPNIARGFNEELGAAASLTIPDAWIGALPDGRFEAVAWLIGALAVLTVVGATANFLHACFAQTLAIRVTTGIRRDLFRRVLHMPLRTVLHAGRGADARPAPAPGTAPATAATGAAPAPALEVSEIVSRITNDTTRLTAGFQALVDKGPAQATKGLAAFIVAAAIDWRALIAAPVALAMAVIIRKLGKRVRRAARGAMEAQSRLTAVSMESLQALRVVKAHTNERAELGRFSRANRALMRETLRARTARALASPLLETIAVFVAGAWALFFAHQIIDRGMDAGRFLASLAGLGVGAAALKPLTSIIQEIQQAAPAATRLAAALGADVEDGFVHADRKGARRAPRHAQSIEFDHVWLTYPGASVPALRDVSLTIEHDETVAFVGGNGSGKTTLLSLVPRLFEPDEGRGRVLLDGADVRSLHLRSLRKQIAVVTQEVALFQGTIASNIAYGAEGATRERIEAAARLARAHEFILAKPGGYDARVGEQGVTLSGGQRQRIALARAFLRDPAILILDEATSMIDAESEAQIAAAIEEFSRGRTTLVIAHRLSTVIHADRIVMMEGGRIVGVGRHDELLGRSAPYRALTASQMIVSSV